MSLRSAHAYLESYGWGSIAARGGFTAAGDSQLSSREGAPLGEGSGWQNSATSLFQVARRDGTLIQEDLIRLHYPCYWYYDILFGLKVLAEAGFIRDAHCQDALDLLETKRLPDGGFPAEKKYYRVSEKATSGRSLVNWGGMSKRKMNPFETVDALYVLHSAGRLQ